MLSSKTISCQDDYELYSPTVSGFLAYAFFGKKICGNGLKFYFINTFIVKPYILVVRY